MVCHVYTLCLFLRRSWPDENDDSATIALNPPTFSVFGMRSNASIEESTSTVPSSFLSTVSDVNAQPLPSNSNASVASPQAKNSGVSVSLSDMFAALNGAQVVAYVFEVALRFSHLIKLHSKSK